MNAREKILDAADDLFGEIGFDAATTREIAARCGVNKALIHYHFSTKDELFRVVLDRYYERLRETILPALEGGGTLRERFERLVDAYVDFLAANRSFSRMVQREASGGRHLERISQQMVPLFEVATELVARHYPAARSGELAASQLLVSFYGMTVSYFTYAPVLERLFDGDPLSPERLDLRKQHLKRMLALAVDALEETGELRGEGR